MDDWLGKAALSETKQNKYLVHFYTFFLSMSAKIFVSRMFCYVGKELQ